jgi:inhibitor of cysteine peptidase
MEHQHMTGRRFWGILFALCVMGAGCSQPHQAATAPQTLDLKEADNAATVQVSRGGEVRVTLDANATTGYSWTLARIDPGVLERTQQEYVAPQTSRVGAGGREVWRFKARSAGTTPLRLEYRRPWEKDTAAARVFEVTVTVR